MGPAQPGEPASKSGAGEFLTTLPDRPPGAEPSFPAQALVSSVQDLGTYDVVIVGAGMGGSTLAWALRGCGARVLVVERGGFLPREYENWDPEAVFAGKRYRNAERWYGADGTAFDPGVYYYVGGNTKLYGAALPRFREADFGPIEHAEGTSAGWPVTYRDLEPFYCQAEQLFCVHGNAGEDPTEPWRSCGYPYPGLPHEPDIAALVSAVRKQGLHPSTMPLGVDRRPGGRCVRCRTCDGFPCMVDAKCDADVSAMRPALRSGNVQLLLKSQVIQLEAANGRVREAVAVRDGRQFRVRGGTFVLACGAVNTAVLLLRSRSEEHPNGLANGSGLLGRNYMVHNSTFFVAVDPRRRNRVRFQKTLAINDWYLSDTPTRWPLGNVQMLGKLQGSMIKGARPLVPMPVLDYMTSHSVDFYLTTEDLAERSNRVMADGDRIVVHWTPNNLASHKELVSRVTQLARAAGYPLIFRQRMGIDVNSHQCGTAVMGEDPATSVVDPTCRSHELQNLWLVDSSPFPSSAAVNPALTIAANTLRVAAAGGMLP